MLFYLAATNAPNIMRKTVNWTSLGAFTLKIETRHVTELQEKNCILHHRILYGQVFICSIKE
jgi:hypothetical protein